MQVIIRGKNPRIKAEELKFAVEWMGRLIMSQVLLDNLDITLSFKEEEGVVGTTEITDTDCNPLPRSFLIRLNPKISRITTIKTLAHELVHVKQFARGEFKDTKYPNLSRRNKQIINHDRVDYWDLPWEIEAFGREYGMYRRYTNHLRESKIKF